MMTNKTALIKELMNSNVSDCTKNPDTQIDELENIRKRLNTVDMKKNRQRNGHACTK